MLNGKQYGFGYISVLIIVAIMVIMTLKISSDLSVRVARGKESELLFNGDQFARAIKSYYESGPVRGCYPLNLEVLLEDRRNFQVLRHLRKIFPDPMNLPSRVSTDSPDVPPLINGGWHLILNENDRIIGVFSASASPPFKQANFTKNYKEFEGKSQYADWKFMAKGSSVKPASPAVCNQ